MDTTQRTFLRDEKLGGWCMNKKKVVERGCVSDPQTADAATLEVASALQADGCLFVDVRHGISANDWRAWLGDRAAVIPGADSGVMENGSRRLATYAEHLKRAEPMRRPGARNGFYLYNLFGHPMDGQVWNGILSKGL